jgi:hypothetical protein
MAVERDPELERALELTKPLMTPGETRSGAAHVRALTLRGAQAILAGSPEAVLQERLADRYEAQTGHGSLADLHAPPGQPDPAGAAPASDALRWVRGE